MSEKVRIALITGGIISVLMGRVRLEDIENTYISQARVLCTYKCELIQDPIIGVNIEKSIENSIQNSTAFSVAEIKINMYNF